MDEAVVVLRCSLCNVRLAKVVARVNTRPVCDQCFKKTWEGGK